jgi:hypothetical protein
MTTENQTSQANQSDQPASGDQDSKQPSEVELLKQENEKLKLDNERIRKEQLEKKTSSSYLRDRQAKQRQQREAVLNNRRLPPGKQLTDEQMSQMSAKEIIEHVNRENQKTFAAVSDKIDIVRQMKEEEDTHSQLERLGSKVPFWKNYLDDMEQIAVENPTLNAEQVLKLAVIQEGDEDRIVEVASLLSGKKRKTAKPKEEPTMPKEKEQPSEGRRPVVSGGEKPTASVGKVTTPQKAMTPREAARAAYEEQRNNL